MELSTFKEKATCMLRVGHVASLTAGCMELPMHRGNCEWVPMWNWASHGLRDRLAAARAAGWPAGRMQGLGVRPSPSRTVSVAAPWGGWPPDRGCSVASGGCGQAATREWLRIFGSSSSRLHALAHAFVHAFN
ncbi:hypothetical protein Dimus_005600, partial [Dionaea muscipula]